MFGFGKKVPLTVPDGKGGEITTKISERKYKQLIREGKLSEEAMCKVNVIHPFGDYETFLTIGKDVDRKTYDSFSDEKGEMYLMIVLEEGVEKARFFQKDIWLGMKSLGAL